MQELTDAPIQRNGADYSVFIVSGCSELEPFSYPFRRILDKNSMVLILGLALMKRCLGERFVQARSR
jgi:hypothetical protein